MNSISWIEATHAYEVKGVGDQNGCIAVQAVLQEHGLCGYTRWSPPYWQFIFQTHLDERQVRRLLGTLLDRYQVQLRSSRATKH
ncbi:MAG: hypothetical protein D6759_14665 [Chloroflexi bacterium]|nr:MAG: hypothetical protein D6759_14665 [Chloroflexota bacterium]